MHPPGAGGRIPPVRPRPVEAPAERPEAIVARTWTDADHALADRVSPVGSTCRRSRRPVCSPYSSGTTTSTVVGRSVRNGRGVTAAEAHRGSAAWALRVVVSLRDAVAVVVFVRLELHARTPGDFPDRRNLRRAADTLALLDDTNRRADAALARLDPNGGPGDRRPRQRRRMARRTPDEPERVRVPMPTAAALGARRGPFVANARRRRIAEYERRGVEVTAVGVGVRVVPDERVDGAVLYRHEDGRLFDVLRRGPDDPGHRPDLVLVDLDAGDLALLELTEVDRDQFDLLVRRRVAELERATVERAAAEAAAEQARLAVHAARSSPAGIPSPGCSTGSPAPPANCGSSTAPG